ncbi:MAG: hypothetical protein NZ480_00020 [Bdellovibrionaceae bacterium]|nr:hypothetical protein [Pseudobdellovibrionaceae bacterium]MDW8189526.1 hypothetical protein [Pseudobdellovibrionaceae bacterium]
MVREEKVIFPVKLWQYRGNVIVWSLLGTVIFGVLLYLSIHLVSSARIQVQDQINVFQARLILKNVVELGKYLLSQERVIYINRPLEVSDERRAALIDLNRQGIGSLDAPRNVMISNACGGYDAHAVQLGDLKVNGDSVFCPFYWRHPNFDGEMLESVLFRHWKESGVVNRFKKVGASIDLEPGATKIAVLKELGNGRYQVEFDLTSSLFTLKNQRFWFHNSDFFINFVKDYSPKLFLKFIFSSFGNSTESARNERFVTIEATMSFRVGLRRMHFHEIQHYVVAAPTIRDFSLFIPYPIDEKGLPTRSFQKAVQFGDQTTRFYGRIFFNGDIDVPVKDLPVFYGPVYITGRLTELEKITDPESRYEVIKEKFKRGIIQNFPASRLIFDGDCSKEGIVTVNHSEIYCKHPPSIGSIAYGIKDYIKNLNNFCSNLKIIATSGSYYYQKPPDLNPPIKAISCVPSAPNNFVISGGVEQIEASGTHVFVASPVMFFTGGSSRGLRIYGVIFGGHISVQPGTFFYSMGQLREGLPGIPDATTLGAISRQIQSIQVGIGVPLMNMLLWKNPLEVEND